MTTAIKGEIGYFGLGDWWLSTFTKEERDYIVETYNPLSTDGNRSRALVEEEIWETSSTAASLLSGLSSWFRKSDDLSIARRLLEKAEAVAVEPLDLHFTYQGQIETYYRSRKTDPAAMDLTVQACQKQIALAPEAAKAFKREFEWQPLPRHVGYDRLIAIRLKERNCAEVARLCNLAKRQGWNGDWETPIARCKGATLETK